MLFGLWMSAAKTRINVLGRLMGLCFAWVFGAARAWSILGSTEMEGVLRI